ncbi:outer membrane protein TolC [Flavobacterium sp. 270]|uniref:TolC family protein n=1 Tax=Flavobacterium sp. 270 TaxID=2512114 RepID=UPI001066259E|nr:TolC family protein [Flavobacterium sp. 270]TDW51690.1 outer membrane protein TolC [Flavobacterium sp. 270]
MRFKYFFFAVWITAVNNIEGQSKIKCDLVEISNMTFNKSPNIKRNFYAIQNAEGELQVQWSTFDFRLNSELSYQTGRLNLYDADPRSQYLNQSLNSNSVDFSAGLQKRFRTSQIAEVSLRYRYNNSNFPYNTFEEFVGPFYGNHTGVLNFSLTQPLLKGRGKKIVTTGEQAAKLIIDKNKLDYEFTNSYEILQMGIAYWNYYTAFKSLEVYIQNEARVRNVLEITKELIKADKKPESDMAQVSADLTSQERLTIVAQQNLYNARLTLGRTIGLSDEESQQLDDPVNDFPVVAESGYKENINKNELIKTAKENRGDLKALQKVTEAVELQLQLAENNLKPQLDLTGFAYYGSTSVGNGVDKTLTSFVHNQGQDVGVGAKLTFAFALNNNLAKGNYSINKTAASDQAVISDNAKRNVDLNVNLSLNNLSNSVLILEKAKESMGFHKTAFDNEQIKFQMGLTTLLNLMLFQERFTFSELEYLNAEQQFSNAIINLRHETGTLVSKESPDFKVIQNAFYTVPNTEN